MATIVGQGDYKYEIKENWAKLPDGWSFKEVAAVGVDRQDNVYCFTRGEHPVIVFAPDGNFLLSWGEPGSDPGQFNLVHNICTDADGWVYVADRENHRVQVFDGNGKYETQWNNLHRPCGLYMDYIRHPVCYIGELSVNRLNANLGPRVSIVDNQGKLLSRIGDPFAGRALTSFIGPHGLTVDSHGDLYVAEVCWTLWPGLFPDQPRPDNLRTIQKYQRVH